MSLIKNLIKYLLILIVIVFGICSILTGIMFLFPSVELFGFKFASNKNDYSIVFTNSNIGQDGNMVEFDIETNHYNIIIMPNSKEGVNNSTELRMAIQNGFTGFANSTIEDSTTGTKKVLNNTYVEDVSTAEYFPVSSFDGSKINSFRTETESGYKYSIKLKEPTGLISYNNCQVVLYLPENAENVVYNLKTNTGKIVFAKNSINSAKTLQTSDITIDVKSAQGSFDLDNANMKAGSNLTIANYLGRVDINSQKIGNVTINSNSGNFTFKNIGYEEFAGSLTVNGNNPYVRVDTIYGNVNFDVTTGFIEAKEIKGDSIIKTENGIIRIDKALGGIETINNSGETTIKQIGESVNFSKAVNINSKSGAIKLGGDLNAKEDDNFGVYYLTKISAESSKVVINNMFAKLRTSGDLDHNIIETTKGSVTVNFADTSDIKYLKVTTTSGAVTLKNVYGVIDAKTGKSGKIYAEFARLAEGHVSNFVTDEGTVELYMPAPTNSADKQFVINAQNRYNKLDVEIGNYSKTSFDGEKDNNGYYNFNKIFPENVATINTINIKTNSGNIIVKEK